MEELDTTKPKRRTRKLRLPTQEEYSTQIESHHGLSDEELMAVAADPEIPVDTVIEKKVTPVELPVYKFADLKLFHSDEVVVLGTPHGFLTFDVGGARVFADMIRHQARELERLQEKEAKEKKKYKVLELRAPNGRQYRSH